MPHATRNSLLAALAVGAAMASPAMAATEYFGGGYMVADSPACSTIGWTGIHQVMARWAPQGAVGNRADQTRLTLLLPTGAITVGYNTASQTRMYQPLATQPAYVWNDAWMPTNPRMQVTIGTSGSASDAQTDVIVRFSNFSEQEGCTVQVVLALHRI